MDILGDIYNQTLKEESLVTYFEAVKAKKIYWYYRQIAIQFEDMVDVFELLYPDDEFIFLFDNYYGNGKKIVYGLGAL